MIKMVAAEVTRRTVARAGSPKASQRPETPPRRASVLECGCPSMSLCRFGFGESNPVRGGLFIDNREPNTGWFSLTPCFSWVRRWHRRQNRFNGLQQSVETVETVPTSFDAVFTQLKQGVNERTSKLRSIGHEICGPLGGPPRYLGGYEARLSPKTRQWHCA